ncbi:hypothetical protein CRG98_010587 [Punica granatum]|uniref:Uncharacterized protein n=1 Tax=Punica granatum TaxID=22663 RepID=A0A2I0KKP3_PUNGR|nr:hypothetical protein CRG98_010587 [Punica granatum]
MGLWSLVRERFSSVSRSLGSCRQEYDRRWCWKIVNRIGRRRIHYRWGRRISIIGNQGRLDPGGGVKLEEARFGPLSRAMSSAILVAMVAEDESGKLPDVMVACLQGIRVVVAHGMPVVGA